MLGESPQVVTEVERTEPASLCLADGTLDPASAGWTRRPLHRCNLSGHWPRKKRWNCWTIFTERVLFSVTVAHLDWAAAASVHLVDLRRGSVAEKRIVLPLSRRAPRMPEHVEASLSLRTRRASVSIVPEGDGTSLLVAWENFLDGDRLSAAFQIHHPMGHESLGVVVPWSRRRFAYTCKDAGLPAQGRIRIGYRELSFESGGAFATGDFGRGLWPRRSTWHHGAACGRIVESSGDDDSTAHVLALNLGGTWTDGTGITENAIWIDGRLDKIPEELTWEINTNDIEAPWHIHARASDAIDLRFVPFARRVAAVDAVVLRYGVRQVFGHYSGNLRNRHGETIEVRDLFGWASEHRAIW